MSDENIFNKSGETDNNINKEQVDAMLASIKNENGDPKYSSLEKAFEGLKNAQEHIATLETENADLRNTKPEVNTEALNQKLEELVKKVGNSQQSGGQASTSKEVSSQEDIAELVRNVVEQDRIVAKQEENVGKVINKFFESYGEKAEEEYKKIAADNGISIEDLNSLAKKAPQTVLKLAGLTGDKSKSTGGMKGDVNTSGFTKQETIPERSKSVFSGGTTKDTVNEWRRVGKLIEQNSGG